MTQAGLLPTMAAPTQPPPITLSLTITNFQLALTTAPTNSQDNPLTTIRRLIFTADRSFADLARGAGLSALVVRRLAVGKRHPRLKQFFIALSRLDIGLIARTKNENRWQVLAIPLNNLPLPNGTELSHLVIEATARLKPLTLVITTTGLSRCAVARLRRGLLPPVISAVLQLLSAVDGQLMAIGGDGTARELLLPKTKHVTLKKYQAPIVKKKSHTLVRPKRGRMTLKKDDILTMHQQLGMNYTRIALIAGVSVERVRQILQLFGVEPLRQRQRRQLIESCQRDLNAPAIVPPGFEVSSPSAQAVVGASPTTQSRDHAHQRNHSFSR